MKNWNYLCSLVMLLVLFSCKNYYEGTAIYDNHKDDYIFDCEVENKNGPQNIKAKITFYRNGYLYIAREENGILSFSGDFIYENYVGKRRQNLICTKGDFSFKKAIGIWQCRLDGKDIDLLIKENQSCVMKKFYKKFEK